VIRCWHINMWIISYSWTSLVVMSPLTVELLAEARSYTVLNSAVCVIAKLSLNSAMPTLYSAIHWLLVGQQIRSRWLVETLTTADGQIEHMPASCIHYCWRCSVEGVDVTFVALPTRNNQLTWLQMCSRWLTWTRCSLQQPASRPQNICDWQLIFRRLDTRNFSSSRLWYGMILRSA